MFGRKPKDEMATKTLESIEKSVLSPREDMADDGIIQNQKKSKEVLKQELTSHLQNFREDFNEVQRNQWIEKHNIILHALTSV